MRALCWCRPWPYPRVHTKTISHLRTLSFPEKPLYQQGTLIYCNIYYWCLWLRWGTYHTSCTCYSCFPFFRNIVHSPRHPFTQRLEQSYWHFIPYTVLFIQFEVVRMIMVLNCNSVTAAACVEIGRSGSAKAGYLANVNKPSGCDTGCTQLDWQPKTSCCSDLEYFQWLCHVRQVRNIIQLCPDHLIVWWRRAIPPPLRPVTKHMVSLRLEVHKDCLISRPLAVFLVSIQKDMQ